jgi:nucleotide-binding universal stress UspA family protein
MNLPNPPWMRRILFATDFSAGSAVAEDYAGHFARSYGAELLLLHVSEPYPTLSADAVAESSLLEPVRQRVVSTLEESAARYERAGIRASARHRVGVPSEEILRLAADEEADVIAIGTRGRTELKDLLLGSTAERVIKGAPCPVITVPAGVNSGGERLLVPFDFFSPSIDALETAVRLAGDFHAQILLLHVLDWAWLRQQFNLTEFANDGDVRTQIETRLGPYADRIRAEGIDVEILIRGGASPVDHILETATEEHVHLIVMGTHGRRGFQRALMGSVAEGVVRRATSSVPA